MPATSGMIAGAYHAQVAFRNSSGYPMGTDTTPDAVSNGAVTHFYKLRDLVSCTAPAVTREVAIERGGQTVKGQRQLGVSDFGSFEMVLSAFDEQFHAYCSGAALDTTLASSRVIGAFNSGNAALPQLMLLLTIGFQTLAGVDEFITYCYPSVTIAPVIPSGSQEGGVNPNPNTYVVVPTRSTRTCFGSLLSATTLAVSDNSDIFQWYRGAYPISISTYIDDGSATSFVVGYRPVNSEHAGAVNIFTKNGVTNHANVSGFSTTTGATTHTAGTAADVWVATYETNFVAI